MRISLITPFIGRRHLEDDLVGLEIGEILIATDGVARLFVPGNQSGIRHRLRELWHLYFSGHYLELFRITGAGVPEAATAGAGVGVAALAGVLPVRRVVSRAESSVVVARSAASINAACSAS